MRAARCRLTREGRCFGRMGRYELGNGPRAISAYVTLGRPRTSANGVRLRHLGPSFVDSNIIGATTLTQLKTDIDARRGA